MYKLRVIVIDAEDDVASGTTKANTAIVHAGYDAKPGTWKAATNLEGSRMYEGLCRQLDVPYSKTGTLVVAIDAVQDEAVRQLKTRGEMNGVPGLEVLDSKRLLEMEPNINPLLKAPCLRPPGPTPAPGRCASR